MSTKYITLGLRKKLVIAVILTGVIVLFVYLNQLENWQLFRPHRFATTFTPIKIVQNTFQNSSLDNKIILRRHPYITDSTCQNFSLSLYEDDTYELTGLISFPGSGNTWVRHLIQLATGVYTGSYYFDMDLFARGFLGEREIWYSGRTIVQKFHEKYDKRMDIKRAILLVREPFSAILSFANYLEAGHTGNAYHLPYHHKDWPNFLLQSAYNWLSLAKSWIESPVTLLVLHYENLRQNPLENLGKICHFLNHSCPYLMSPCFKNKMEGSFHRMNSPPVTNINNDAVRKAKYPTELKNVISRGIDHLNNLLRQHGYGLIPLELYKSYSVETVESISFANISQLGTEK